MREIEVKDDTSICVEEQYDVENEAGAVVWDAALVLSYFLIHCQVQSDLQKNMHNKSVIELGSGTGLVGLVSAALGANPVILTDLPHLMTHMNENIKLNKLGNSVSAEPLEWGNISNITAILKKQAQKLLKAEQDPSSTSTSKAKSAISKMYPDVILGSDLLYKATELESLFLTLALLSGPQTTIILCYEDRTGIEAFHDVAKAHGFVERKVPEDLLHPDWRSPDIHIVVLVKTEE